MAHLIRENAGKETKMISELFTNKSFEFTFVSIFADMTIPGFLLKPILWIELIVLTFTYHHYFHAPVSFHKILLLC